MGVAIVLLAGLAMGQAAISRLTTFTTIPNAWRMTASDGASYIDLGTLGTWTWSFRSANATAAYIDSTGVVVYNPGGTHALHAGNKCDSTASPGNATCNAAGGLFSVAAGAAPAVIITNSACTATTRITALLQTADATAVLKNCVPAAGSFTCNFATVAAQTNVSWELHK
jgi:hypothetical protein